MYVRTRDMYYNAEESNDPSRKLNLVDLFLVLQTVY